MSDRDVIAALQRQAAEAEVERLRLVGELEAMRERAEQAEARLASISGVTREELVAAERAKRAGLLAFAQRYVDSQDPCIRGDGTCTADDGCVACELTATARAAIAKATT